MDLASDGRALYQAESDGRTVIVTEDPHRPFPMTYRTKSAPGPLMGERIAVSPLGSVAVVARVGSGPFQDQAYACRLGQDWIPLGPSAKRQAVAWIGGEFLCARVGPGGRDLVVQTLDGEIRSTGPANTSQGVLYYDALDARWVIESQAVTQVGRYQMIKAIRLRLANGLLVACGQVTNPDRIVIASFDGSIAFNAGPQINTPVFTAVGSLLACVVWENKKATRKTFAPPYPTVDLPAPPPPPPPPPPEPPMPPTIPNHKATVEKWRAFYADLPPGNERGWKIANATAWDHRAEGAGILSKPSGNNWKGYAIDIVVYPDGRHFDVLVDGEGEARPTWRLITNPPKVDPARWRAALNPNATPGPEPPPTPPPNPPPPSPPAPTPPPVSYDQFVKVEAQQVFDRYHSVHGRQPAPSDLAHNSYRRLVQGWTHEAILADIGK